MNPIQRHAGVTLIELMVALIVLAIGIVIAGPGLTNFSGSSKLEAQSREIQNALVFARSEAIRLNQNVLFCHSADSLVCSTPPVTGWMGWLVVPAAVAIGSETGPVLRANLFSDSTVKVSSGSVLASAQHALLFNSQGLIRMFGNNTPLNDSINLCIADLSLQPNQYEVRFNSGGRLQQITTDTDGVCL